MTTATYTFRDRMRRLLDRYGVILLLDVDVLVVNCGDRQDEFYVIGETYSAITALTAFLMTGKDEANLRAVLGDTYDVLRDAVRQQMAARGLV